MNTSAQLAMLIVALTLLSSSGCGRKVLVREADTLITKRTSVYMCVHGSGYDVIEVDSTGWAGLLEFLGTDTSAETEELRQYLAMKRGPLLHKTSLHEMIYISVDPSSRVASRILWHSAQ